MKFTRFGNTFIGEDDGSLYVVSWYLSSWHAYVRNNSGGPTEIGRYGYGSHTEAMDAARTYAGRS